MSRTLLFVAGLSTTLACCSSSTDTELSETAPLLAQAVAAVQVPPQPPEQPEPWAPWFDPGLANGFDFPIGNADGKGSYTDKATGTQYNGWYIATHTAEVYSLGIHTGEDWNGNGGSNTDLGQPVFSTAAGTVVAADHFGFPWGNIAMVRHCYVENAKIDTVFSLYAHLDELHVTKGDVVQKREQLGTIGTGDDAYPAHLHFELRTSAMRAYEPDYWPSSNNKSVEWVQQHYLDPSDFIRTHRQVERPADLPECLLAIKHDYHMYHFKKGQFEQEYEIALSQNPIGHKVEQGDNRLPEGAYKLIQKSRGPFEGAMGPFFGTGWIRISYPNAYDAKAGLAKGLISKAECASIKKATAEGREPTKFTRLGGGIGIHGWAGEWRDYPVKNLTWGCITMHNEDLDVFIDKVALNCPILITP